MAEDVDARIQFRGISEMRSRLAQLGAKVRIVAAEAVREEAEVELKEAQRRTPVLTGALKASGRVEGPTAGKTVTATIRFGGDQVTYALPVHENLEAFHRVGQAKFLESVIRESAPYMQVRIAARIAEELGLH